ncbi:hypothetical protein CDAR_437831 [Caerostris darwini]|uniref:Uncharacterized protein n=1 Tax=Caerostris darwini TaxID=1538125 RepID=A0AAV4NSL4_9ARAC|nr:hypothetical protein CDAR_437831 [Caerostris darwini]
MQSPIPSLPFWLGWKHLSNLQEDLRFLSTSSCGKQQMSKNTLVDHLIICFVKTYFTCFKERAVYLLESGCVS